MHVFRCCWLVLILIEEEIVAFLNGKSEEVALAWLLLLLWDIDIYLPRFIL